MSNPSQSKSVFLAVLLWVLLLAQAGAIIHQLDHELADKPVACALCIAGDHLAAPPTVSAFFSGDAGRTTLPGVAIAFLPSLRFTPYLSRAPPGSLSI